MQNKPKIAFAGNLNTLPYSYDHKGIRQGLEMLGIDYEILDFKEHYSGKADIFDKIRIFQPDIIIWGMTDALTENFPAKAALISNAKQVFCMWDYRPKKLYYDGLWNKWKSQSKFLDLITLSSKEQIQWWQDEFRTKVIYLPHGCVMQESQYDDNFRRECVFIGARNNVYPYNERVKLINAIAEKINLTWLDAGGGDDSPERAQMWQDMAKYYHSSISVLDISHFWDVEGYASGRYFYSAGLGGCSITRRFLGCDELYPEGVKLYFTTVDEAIQKINLCLKNPEYVKQIKEKAKEWTKKYHNYKIRFQELLKNV